MSPPRSPAVGRRYRHRHRCVTLTPPSHRQPVPIAATVTTRPTIGGAPTRTVSSQRARPWAPLCVLTPRLPVPSTSLSTRCRRRPWERRQRTLLPAVAPVLPSASRRAVSSPTAAVAASPFPSAGASCRGWRSSRCCSSSSPTSPSAARGAHRATAHGARRRRCAPWPGAATRCAGAAS